jgi:hypothetical protein
MVPTIASSSDKSASPGQQLGDHVGVAGGRGLNWPARGRFLRNQLPGQRGGAGQVAVVGHRDPAAGGGLEHRRSVLPAPAARAGVAGVADGQVPLGGWPGSPRRTPPSPAPSPGRRACRDRRRRQCRPTPGRGAGSASSPSSTRLATGSPGAHTPHASRGWSTPKLILPKRGVWERHADANRFCAADTNSGPCCGDGAGDRAWRRSASPHPDRLRRPPRSAARRWQLTDA